MLTPIELEEQTRLTNRVNCIRQLFQFQSYIPVPPPVIEDYPPDVSTPVPIPVPTIDTTPPSITPPLPSPNSIHSPTQLRYSTISTFETM